MKIGELAERSGLAPSRIRFYESSGLLSMVERQANGYREYGPDAVMILNIIVNAQNAGFSLDEIRNLLPANLNDWKHGELLDGLKRKITEIETMQKRLMQSKKQLKALIKNIEDRPDGMACADNAQRVLARLRGDGVI